MVRGRLVAPDGAAEDAVRGHRAERVEGRGRIGAQGVDGAVPQRGDQGVIVGGEGEREDRGPEPAQRPLLAAVEIPDLHGAVHPAGGHLAAVRGERHRAHLVAGAAEDPALGGDRVPDAQRPVEAARHEQPAVGRAGHAGDRPLVPFERAALPGLQVGEADRAVLAGRGQGPAVAEEEQVPRLVAVPLHDPARAGGDVPQAHGAVVAAGGEEAPVAGEGEIVDGRGVPGRHGGDAVGAGVLGDHPRGRPAIEARREGAQPGDGPGRIVAGLRAGLHQREIVGAADGLALGRLGLAHPAAGLVAGRQHPPEAQGAAEREEHEGAGGHQHGGAVAAREAAQALQRRVGVGAHLLPVGEAAQVVGEGARALVPLGGIARHRLVHDGPELRGQLRLPGLERPGRAVDHLADDPHRRPPVVRRAPRDQVVDDGPQRVHVGALVDGEAAGLLRRHVGRRPQHRARHGERVGGVDAPPLPLVPVRAGLGHRVLAGEVLGEAPVDHHRLAERPDQHVARLEIAVEDAAAVGVGHGVRRVDDVGEQRQPVHERRLLDEDVGQAPPVHELHGIERLARRPLPRLVERDDGRVLELGGDHHLPHEALAVRSRGVEAHPP